MTSNEFSPYKHFINILNLWWLVFVAALLGGVAGFIFFQLHRPVYEATATYYVAIDQARFPFHGLREDLVQYNEDMAVNTTGDVLVSSAVINDVINQLKSLGFSLTSKDILENYTIERKQETWELRYRNQVPQDAQTVVNLWAQIGYQAMNVWQAAGKIPAFVIFQSPSPAILPTQPVVYGRNNLMLAGALIGLVIGIIVSGRLNTKTNKSSIRTDNPPDL